MPRYLWIRFVDRIGVNTLLPSLQWPFSYSSVTRFIHLYHLLCDTFLCGSTTRFYAVPWPCSYAVLWPDYIRVQYFLARTEWIIQFMPRRWSDFVNQKSIPLEHGGPRNTHTCLISMYGLSAYTPLSLRDAIFDASVTWVINRYVYEDLRLMLSNFLYGSKHLNKSFLSLYCSSNTG